MKYPYTFLALVFLLLFSGCVLAQKQGVVVEFADNKLAVSELLKFDIANYTDEEVIFKTCPSPYFLEMKEGDSFNDFGAREKRGCKTIPLEGKLKPGDKVPFEVPFNWVKREGMKTGKYRIVFVYEKKVEAEKTEEIGVLDRIEEAGEAGEVEETVEIDETEEVKEAEEVDETGEIDETEEAKEAEEAEEVEKFEVYSDVFELLAVEGVEVVVDQEKYKSGDKIGFKVINNNPIPIFFNVCESEYFLEEKKSERGYNRVWFSGEDLPQCENFFGDEVKLNSFGEVHLELDSGSANFSDTSPGAKPMRVFFSYYVKMVFFEKSEFLRETSEIFEVEF